jgi:histidyl-tRNA synthetase
VYETVLVGHEGLGSVCSGGRYDNLASTGTETYPGVGLSIGVSRLLGRLFGIEALAVSRAVPTCVLVALPDEDARPAAMRVAARLRERDIPTEVSPSAAKYGKQIRTAARRGIPYVWFPGEPDTVKDIRSGDQVEADAATWRPPDEDVRPVVTAPGSHRPR